MWSNSARNLKASSTIAGNACLVDHPSVESALEASATRTGGSPALLSAMS